MYDSLRRSSGASYQKFELQIGRCLVPPHFPTINVGDSNKRILKGASSADFDDLTNRPDAKIRQVRQIGKAATEIAEVDSHYLEVFWTSLGRLGNLGGLYSRGTVATAVELRTPNFALRTPSVGLLEEIGSHSLQVVHRAAVLILIQHRAQHAHGIGRVRLRLLLLIVKQARQV